jgi:hypothetical protein
MAIVMASPLAIPEPADLAGKFFSGRRRAIPRVLRLCLGLAGVEDGVDLCVDEIGQRI